MLLQAVGAYLWSQTSIQTLVALHQGVAFFLYLEADSFWHCYYRLVLQCCFLYYGTQILGHCCLALLLRCCFLYLTDSFRHRCHHLLLQGPHKLVVFSIMCLSDSFRFWFHHLLLHILFKHVEELQFYVPLFCPSLAKISQSIWNKKSLTANDKMDIWGKEWLVPEITRSYWKRQIHVTVI